MITIWWAVSVIISLVQLHLFRKRSIVMASVIIDGSNIALMHFL